jgi:membrane carboxypeptidase/penicillin-binding protein PbpC
LWKTGTSSGRRDAWAVGHNYRYAIGVWVGRFRGTGRYEYVGGMTAEPVLARLFIQPLLQGGYEPGQVEPIVVMEPMPVPVSLDSDLHIVSPGDGEVFIAYDGLVDIIPQANVPGDYFWFLNDKLLENNHLQLGQGNYRLKCLADDGSVSVASFEIKSF